MSHRLFKVDLSDGAWDFKPTATEPGLAMLDRNNANYSILRRWLGEFVAEPEWMGQDAHFFVREDARGRLENIHCIPCTKADLLGPLQPQLEEIDQKLRRAKPETANEQLLHRIVRKKFADLTRDYDASDFHCHFFKYRQGSEPWRLVWAWGYQRTDMEPARSIICGNPECEALYAKRPKQRARCPVCASTAARGRKPPAPLWLRIAQVALLLLLLLGGIMFFAFNQPRLVVTPDDWSGPPGSRVNYQAQHKAWFFFNNDVTDRVVPQSEDKRVMRFGPSGTQAKARSPGNVRLTFHYKNLTSAATAHVGQPKQPASVNLEPAGDIDVRTGATKEVKLIGSYDEKEKLDPVDLSEMAEWTAEDAAIAFFVRPGVCEGGTEGITNITARYRASEKDPWLPATAKAVVKKVDYQAIELAVVPQSIGMGQSGRIDVQGVGPDGAKYSLLGSSLLKLSVEPEDIAKIDGDYLVGLAKGDAALKATFLGFTGEAEFNVGNSLLAAGTFVVTPAEAKIRVNEYLDLDVLSASSEPIETTSSDGNIVEVVGDRTIVGRAPGKATVTLAQGSSTTTVDVTVSESNLVTLRIEPSVITLVSGVTSGFRVYAVDKSGEEIDVVPDRITWIKQPPADYARLSRDTMTLTGLTPSDEYWPLVAQLGTNENIRAQASVRVVASPLASTSIIDLGGDEFLVHPPVSVYGGTRYVLETGTATGGDLIYDGGGIVVGDDVGGSSLFTSSGLRPGYRIISHRGKDLTGLSRDQLITYFKSNPILPSDAIGYEYEGARGLVKLGVTSVAVSRDQDVRLLGVKTENVTPDDFTAALDLDLREAGEYRITTGDGESLTEWQELGPTPLTTMVTSKIPRNASDRYELFVERRLGDAIDRYQLRITLTEMSP